VGLQFGARPIGAEGAFQPPVDKHVEHRARRCVNTLAHPARDGDAFNRLENTVDLLRTKSQRGLGELGAIAKHPDRCAGGEPVRRDRAEKAAEAVVAVDPGQFTARPSALVSATRRSSTNNVILTRRRPNSRS
jgi:hypothetical protein